MAAGEMRVDLSVVISVYNEADNLEVLTAELRGALAGGPPAEIAGRRQVALHCRRQRSARHRIPGGATLRVARRIRARGD